MILINFLKMIFLCGFMGHTQPMMDGKTQFAEVYDPDINVVFEIHACKRCHCIWSEFPMDWNTRQSYNQRWSGMFKEKKCTK